MVSVPRKNRHETVLEGKNTIFERLKNCDKRIRTTLGLPTNLLLRYSKYDQRYRISARLGYCIVLSQTEPGLPPVCIDRYLLKSRIVFFKRDVHRIGIIIHTEAQCVRTL